MFVLPCINKSSTCKGKESNDDGGDDENDDEPHRVPHLGGASSYSRAL